MSAITPWSDSFTMCTTATDSDGNEQTACTNQIELRQTSTSGFVLDNTITYVGSYRHADGRPLDAEWRTVGPAFETDLASVPPIMRWMVNSYGAHTPAAHIHDKLIPDSPIPGNHQAEVEADRYFRHMMAEVGVPFVTRWIMWAGVALRTKWQNGWTNRVTLIAWASCAVIGLTMFTYGVATWSLAWILGSALPILPATAVWRAQWGFGLIAAFALPVIVPAVIPLLAAITIGRVANFFVERPGPKRQTAPAELGLT